jgi:hypothetical protein
VRLAPLASVALAALALALAACGGGGAGPGSGALRWEQEPTIVRSAALPDDQVVSGTVRNDSLRELNLAAAKVRLLDGTGKRVPGVAVFLESFAHGLFPPTRGPFPRPAAEDARIGLIARVKPGAKLPFTVAWRLPEGVSAPVRIDYGLGWLPIPEA